ncbi:hypothetical protein NJB1604_31530 [Mycobacterium marinum]|uniref:hypothetical protein n=1 Tax=Mycobacterium marinum TaxID=1781 RepID=UPI0021C4472E|nr:hypothetical protein [Mycobacterium marinum]GJO48516.1 hypothetical protein NJB1604_31530 [Mycobacterium marinum]
MRLRRPLLAAFIAALVFAVGPAVAEPEDAQLPLHNEGRYVFTQQHRDNLSWWNRAWTPQLVPKGAMLEVQLPSTPVHWIPYGEPECQPSPGWDWAEISGSWYPTVRRAISVCRCNWSVSVLFPTQTA